MSIAYPYNWSQFVDTPTPEELPDLLQKGDDLALTFAKDFLSGTVHLDRPSLATLLFSGLAAFSFGVLGRRLLGKAFVEGQLSELQPLHQPLPDPIHSNFLPQARDPPGVQCAPYPSGHRCWCRNGNRRVPESHLAGRTDSGDRRTDHQSGRSHRPSVHPDRHPGLLSPASVSPNLQYGVHQGLPSLSGPWLPTRTRPWVNRGK